MHPATHQLRGLSKEELAILMELPESERVKLLVEVRQTDHTAYRDKLRRRQQIVKQLEEGVRMS